MVRGLWVCECEFEVWGFRVKGLRVRGLRLLELGRKCVTPSC